jgi:hypothetical protein
MTVDSGARRRPRASRLATLKLVAAATVPVWVRAVLVLVGATVLTHAVGLGDASSYATLPGIS